MVGDHKKNLHAARKWDAEAVYAGVAHGPQSRAEMLASFLSFAATLIMLL